eukprot:CAMPEP_0181392778 /NCGR_PEP_ID=MMETSP1106-20121128/26783_1 /TAXON_ID=81844 /ORGANISM="Mantoniella antarctica, Strain SL-175" /LENGTH=724 /DNA_ID=CAMNT_0023513945 /DNA_START=237 /DNA_END=2409 /DNA_ORIENTATION=+
MRQGGARRGGAEGKENDEERNLVCAGVDDICDGSRVALDVAEPPSTSAEEMPLTAFMATYEALHCAASGDGCKRHVLFPTFCHVRLDMQMLFIEVSKRRGADGVFDGVWKDVCRTLVGAKAVKSNTGASHQIRKLYEKLLQPFEADLAHFFVAKNELASPSLLRKRRNADSNRPTAAESPEALKKYMRDAAAHIPPMKMETLRVAGTLVEDPDGDVREAKLVQLWTEGDKQIFHQEFVASGSKGKDFERIAGLISGKSTRDCVVYYYQHQKTGDGFRELREARATKRIAKKGENAEEEKVESESEAGADESADAYGDTRVGIAAADDSAESSDESTDDEEDATDDDTDDDYAPQIARQPTATKRNTIEKRQCTHVNGDVMAAGGEHVAAAKTDKKHGGRGAFAHTHTQLPEAIESGEIVLTPDDDNVTCKRAVNMRIPNRKHVMSDSSDSGQGDEDLNISRSKVTTECAASSRDKAEGLESFDHDLDSKVEPLANNPSNAHGGAASGQDLSGAPTSQSGEPFVVKFSRYPSPERASLAVATEPSEPTGIITTTTTSRYVSTANTGISAMDAGEPTATAPPDQPAPAHAAQKRKFESVPATYQLGGSALDSGSEVDDDPDRQPPLVSSVCGEPAALDVMFVESPPFPSFTEPESAAPPAVSTQPPSNSASDPIIDLTSISSSDDEADNSSGNPAANSALGLTYRDEKKRVFDGLGLDVKDFNLTD